MKKLPLLTAFCAIFGVCSCSCNSEYPNARSKEPDTDYRCPRDSRDNQDNDSADWQITTRVKAALAVDTGISGGARFVSVETNEGVVTLTGSVSSKEESRYIERKVKATNGVRKVNNQLKINP